MVTHAAKDTSLLGDDASALGAMERWLGRLVTGRLAMEYRHRVRDVEVRSSAFPGGAGEELTEPSVGKRIETTPGLRTRGQGLRPSV